MIWELAECLEGNFADEFDSLGVVPIDGQVDRDAVDSQCIGFCDLLADAIGISKDQGFVAMSMIPSFQPLMLAISARSALAYSIVDATTTISSLVTTISERSRPSDSPRRRPPMGLTITPQTRTLSQNRACSSYAPSSFGNCYPF